MHKHWSYALGALMAVFVVVLVLSSCGKTEEPMSQVERGKYLVMVGGCNDCHSPKIFTAKGPIPDTTRLLSGFQSHEALPEIPKGIIGPNGWGGLINSDMTAFVGPWGVSFAANLTPDPKTGIGDWPEEMFIKVLRSGKFMGMSRDILPPMPWQAIGQMSDADLKAIFAYLKSLPPVENLVPAPLPPQGQ
jgi:hypothetical protein